MKKLRALAAFTFIGAAAFANSAMDLQFVKRWNISGPLVADFTHIVAKPGGGYFAAGTMNRESDLFLMSLDANANVLASRRWDSLARTAETLVDVDVDSNGDAYILAYGGQLQSADLLYLAKFDGMTLATDWERPISGPSAFGSFAMCRSGSGVSEAIFVGATTNSDLRVTRFNMAGSNLGTSLFAHPITLRVMKPMPSSAQGGVALGGYYGSKPFVGHVNSAGATVLDHQINAANSFIDDLAVSPTGALVGVGGPFSGDLTVYRQNSGTSFTTFSRPGYGYARGVAHLSGVGYLVSSRLGSDGLLVPWNSSTGAFETGVPAGSAGEIRKSSDGSRYGVGPQYAFGALSPVGPSAAPAAEVIDVAPHGESDLLGAGTGGVLFTAQSSEISSGLTVSGYVDRTVEAAIADGQGGLFQLVAPQGGAAHLQRLAANGAMTWNRAIFAPNVSGQTWSKMSRFSNGDFCLVARMTGGFGLARVSQSGTVSFAKRIALSGYGSFRVSDMLVDSQNRVWVGGVAVLNQSQKAIIARVNADGGGLQVLNASSGDWSRLRSTVDGEVLAQFGFNPVRLLRLNSEGVQLGAVNIADGTTASFDVAASGASISAGVIGGQLTITARDPALNQLWTQQIASAVAPTVKYGPSGEVRVVYYLGSSYSIRAYSATGSVLWTTAIPAAVTQIHDLDVDMSNGWAYVTGGENSAVPSDASVNVVRFLANGVRSAQRKTAGAANIGLLSGPSFWALGDVTTRYKAREASSTKWALP